MSKNKVIHLEEVCKVYKQRFGDVVALNGVSMSVGEGEFIAIMGPSGSGKSTLLNQLGILDVPTSGELLIDGHNTRMLDDTALTRLRRDKIGYIFQKFNLISTLTAYENVEYPGILKTKKRDELGRAYELLESVGISRERAGHTPNELSGGQQQRVAIARALINDPAILLCDEPTGNLDSKTGLQIMDMLSELNQSGRTIVMVTHDSHIADYADRTIVIADGRIVS